MLMLMEGHDNHTSKNILYNNNSLREGNPKKMTRNEIEDFSNRLSTALRRNRNVNSAASNNKLFTKVTSFTQVQLQKSIEIEDESTIKVNSSKDNWSLDECLSEINSIKYDNFINGIHIKTEPTVERSSRIGNNIDYNRNRDQSPLFLLEQNQSEEYNNVELPNSSHPNNPRIRRSMSVTSSENELLFGENESIGSSESSISWAADAVEAKLTLQLARLWEDVELVCSGQFVGRPIGMSNAVYEECLLWKRAFPEKSEHPSRFSTMSLVPENEGDSDSDSTVTPTNTTQLNEEFDLPSMSAKYRTSSIKKFNDVSDYYDYDSRAESCVTPNPSNSKEYVTAWLTECHPHSQTNEKIDQTQNDTLQEEDDDDDAETIKKYLEDEVKIKATNHLRKLSQNIIYPPPLPSRLTSCNTTTGHLITPHLTGNHAFPKRINGKNNASGKSNKSIIDIGSPNLPINNNNIFVFGEHSQFSQPHQPSASSIVIQRRKESQKQSYFAHETSATETKTDSKKLLLEGLDISKNDGSDANQRSPIQRYLDNQNKLLQSPIPRKINNSGSKDRSPSTKSFGKFHNDITENEIGETTKKTPFLLWLFDNT